MTAADNSNLALGQRRRILLLGLAVAGLGLAAMAAWWSAPGRSPVPPTIDLAGADPEVAAAVAAARAEVLRQPRSASAWGRLGMVLRAHDYAAEAVDCFAQAERLDPTELRWPYLHGLSLVLTDPVRAWPLLHRAADLAGSDVTPRLRLAEALLDQGRLDEAEAQARQALEQAPGPLHPRAHLVLAQVMAQRGEVKESLGHLRRCTEGAPFVRAAFVLLAELHHRQGDVAAADHAARMLAAHPDDVAWPDPYVEEVERLRSGADARVGLAGQLLGQGRAAEALGLLEQTVRAHPQAAHVHHALGRAWMQVNRLPAAEQALREAARLEPQAAEAWFDLGVCLHQQGQIGQAVATYRHVLALTPAHAFAHYNLALCLKEQGDLAAAEPSLRDALRYKPAYAAALRALGELLAGQKRDAEAIVPLEHAVGLDPGDTVSQELLHRCRARTAAP